MCYILETLTQEKKSQGNVRKDNLNIQYVHKEQWGQKKDQIFFKWLMWLKLEQWKSSHEHSNETAERLCSNTDALTNVLNLFLWEKWHMLPGMHLDSILP